MVRPWMPLYIADYRNKTAHLTAAEHGAYLLLIMHYWVNSGLPSDESQLMRVAAMTPQEWKKSRGVLQAFFHDGWSHERVDEELRKAEQISSKRRASAMLRHSKDGAIADANAPANAEQLQCKSTHTRGVVVSSLVDSLELKEVSEEKSSGRPRPKRREKTPLPDDFEPDRQFPCSLGWSQERIDQQIQCFKASALAHNRVYANWQAAWRNWCLSPFQAQVTTDGTDRESGKQKFKRALRRVHEFAAGANGDLRGEAVQLLASPRYGQPGDIPDGSD